MDVRKGSPHWLGGSLTGVLGSWKWSLSQCMFYEEEWVATVMEREIVKIENPFPDVGFISNLLIIVHSGCPSPLLFVS